MSDLSIRPAVHADIPGLKRCIDMAYAQYRVRLADLPDVSDGLDHDIDCHRVLLIEDRGQVVGAMILKETPAFLQLANIAVHPDQAGKGLGKALIGDAVRIAQSLGYTRLNLTTHAAIPENIALYTHLGWAETGRDGNKVFMGRQV